MKILRWMGIGLWIGSAAGAGGLWQIEAPMNIGGAGMVEWPLPPALHVETAEGLDLTVLGPEGQPRPVELYWREVQGHAVFTLVPDQETIEGNQFVWISRVRKEQEMLISSVRVSVLSDDYVGKVNVEGRIGGQWQSLAHHAAVYRSQGMARAEIHVTPGFYKAFRLALTTTGKKPVPIDRVEIEGDLQGKGVVETVLTLPVVREEVDGEVWLSAKLPGSGVWVKEILVRTQGRFVGTWQAEREVIANGKRETTLVVEGEEPSIGKGSGPLKVVVDRVWPGRTLKIKLNTGGRFLGLVEPLQVTVLLPRLVFVADAPGTYRIQAGGGDFVKILETPSDSRKRSSVSATMGNVRKNPDWKPQGLIQQYHLAGAPFDARGYSWKSSLSVPEPGYYRVVLHERASLEGRYEGLRVVRQGIQVPYVMDLGEEREVPLKTIKIHDEKKNETVWRIELPRASRYWQTLIVKADGIFKRHVIVERETPEPRGVPVFFQTLWHHETRGESVLRIPLGNFPNRETNMSMKVEHGDNRPINLKEMRAVYRAPALYFLAEASEGYELFGGHAQGRPPKYDLQLIHSRLLEHEPRSSEVGEPQPFRGEGIMSAFASSFQRTAWGLYFVLGILTISLLVVIVRLFPKPSGPTH